MYWVTALGRTSHCRGPAFQPRFPGGLLSPRRGHCGLPCCQSQRRLRAVSSVLQPIQRSSCISIIKLFFERQNLCHQSPWGSQLGPGTCELGGTTIHSQASGPYNMPHVQSYVFPLGCTCLRGSHCLSFPKLRPQLPVQGSPPTFRLASLLCIPSAPFPPHLSTEAWGLLLKHTSRIWEGQVHQWYHL